MAEPFKIRLAGLVIKIESLSAQTQVFCKAYLTDEQETIRLTIRPSDIAFEREKAAREAEVEGTSVRYYPDHYLESLAVCRKIAEALLAHDILLFHGSAIAVDGEGYLFAAKSGTGKSTHARLWREQFGKRAFMVNDDKPLLKFTDGGILVCGTPWDGKHHLSSNCSVPLKALCLLTRDEATSVEPISPKAAWTMLLQQAYRPKDPVLLRKTITLVDRLAESASLYRLRADMRPGAALASYNGINGTSASGEDR